MAVERRPNRTSGIVALALLLSSVAAWALEVPEKPLGRVSDFAGLLSPADRAHIESRLRTVEEASSNQFAVAIFRSLEGESLEDFSIRLAEAWKVGHAGRDNGLLLLVFVDDRKVRIEVGYGLEGTIPDAVAGRVIRDVLAPPFREGRYAEGIFAAVEALDAASRGEFQPLPDRGRGVPAPIAGLVPFLLLLIFIGVLGSLRRAAHLGPRSRRAHGGGFWWIGPGGFGGGLGGGGGGFGGGGGGFGGGGASGGW